MIRVKVIPNWCSSCEYIPKIWPKLSPDGDLKWGNVQIVTEGKADYYVLLNAANTTDYYEPDKSIIFHMEGGIRQNKYWNWGEFSNPDPKKFLRIMDCANFRAVVEWWISQPYKKLLEDIPKNPNPEYNRILTSVMSQNYFSEGHQKRVNFLRYLENNIEKYSDKSALGPVKLHLWGGGWKCGLPKLESHFMDIGIMPYKYWFHAERSDEPGYFCGGKLISGIVSECLTFYWGCSDIEKWIDPRAFIRVDLDNYEKAMDTIVNAINNNEWEKRLPYIRQMKYKILNELQVLPTIHKVVNDIEAEKKPKTGSVLIEIPNS